MADLKRRNVSIDILKFFAVLLITNSHMELLYGEYSVLATGGAIGDVLFFFCSGYTLFLGKERSFCNYYKRRISRIYPSVVMWALLKAMFFDIHRDMLHVVLFGGGWFVSCIMIYYVILHFVRKYFSRHLMLAWGFFVVVTLLWYLMMDRDASYNMYGATFFKWCHYFLFMLFGAIVGVKRITVGRARKPDIIKWLGCILLFYAILLVCRNFSSASDLQILSLVPLLGIVIYFYKLCNSARMFAVYNSKIAGTIIKLVSGLCLEVYFVQDVVFTDKLNSLFPLNILILFVPILFLAYILRCLARLFTQTFREGDYVWKDIFKVTG